MKCNAFQLVANEHTYFSTITASILRLIIKLIKHESKMQPDLVEGAHKSKSVVEYSSEPASEGDQNLLSAFDESIMFSLTTIQVQRLIVNFIIVNVNMPFTHCNGKIKHFKVAFSTTAREHWHLKQESSACNDSVIPKYPLSLVKRAKYFVRESRVIPLLNRNRRTKIMSNSNEKKQIAQSYLFLQS
jgi:hypothetical protein